MITAHCSIILRLSSVTYAQLGQVLDTMKEFVGDCHRHHAAFAFLSMGSSVIIGNTRNLLQDQCDPDVELSLGNQFPDQEQSPGRSTISQVSLSDIFGSDSGGGYEDFAAKALVVFIYHLWKENYKKRLIALLSISENDIEWDLMEDIRLVRNKIIHENSIISTEILNRLRILPRIWNIQEGQVVISSKMIQALFEQVNVTKISIVPPQ